MDIGRQRRSQAIFELALELPAADRRAFLERECGDDTELREATLVLLAADIHGAGFLGEPLPRPHGGDAEALTDYRVLGVIGYGGMSTVYLAEPLETPGERVAIKVLSPHLPPLEFARRFAAEQRIVASLGHPMVVPVTSAGTTADGRPYLVMPQIEGEPLTEYCDRARLNIEERIRLFLRVCEVVAAAHEHLVVHRDLKPSNILVTPAGEPRLLDFGIATVLDESAERTATENRVLTRNYASPEHLAGEPVTTASDVYSLGVLLHELLCGRRPHDWGERLPGDIAAALASAGPVRMSAGIESSARDAAVAEACGTTPVALRRRLHGDLDTIVAKSLLPDSRRRYRTVNALSEDLNRHLDGQPIAARPTGRLYRVGKLLHRHPIESAVAASLLLAIVALAIVATVQAVKAERQRTAAVAAAQLAEHERAVADGARRETQQVMELFLESFEVVGSPQARGGVVAASAIVAQGEQRAAQLAAYPEPQAALRHALGIAYLRLGLYRDAQRVLEEALATRRKRFGPDAPATLETLSTSAAVLRELGQLEESERRARAVLAARQRADPRHPSTAAAARELAATLLTGTDRDREAGALAADALAIDRAAAHDANAIADDLRLVAHVHFRAGEFAAAETAMREAIERMGATEGEESPESATLLHDLASTVLQQGRLDEAVPLMRRSCETTERLLGAAHPDVADCRDSLAELQQRRGELTEALGEQEKALAVRRQAFGEDHPDVAMSLASMAKIAYSQGRLQEAEAWAREALAIRRRTLPADHQDLAMSMQDVAAILGANGHWRESAGLFREVLDLYRRSLGTSHPEIATTLTNLGWTVWNGGDGAAAEALFRQGLEMRRAVLGDAHPDYGTSCHHLARLRRRRGDAEQAEALVREALNVRRGALGDGHPNTADSRVELAVQLLLSERAEGAREEAAQALAVYRGTLPDRHPRVGMAHLVHGVARVRLGDRGGAEEARAGRAAVMEGPSKSPVLAADAELLLDTLQPATGEDVP